MRAISRRLFEPSIDAKMLREHFTELKIQPGTCLLVHASLSAPGFILGGASTLIGCLSDHVGSDGTIMFPAHTWRSTNAGNRKFDVLNSKSEVGYVPEFFRKQEGVLRSVHPSHSVCVKGPRSKFLIQDHCDASSPCGEGTPYSRLMDLEGQILLFSVGLERNTCFHCVEALAEVPYLLKKEKDEFEITDANGIVSSRMVQCHAKAVPSRFADLESELVQAECLRFAKLGNSVSYVLEAGPFRDFLLPILENNPSYLLAEEVQ